MHNMKFYRLSGLISLIMLTVLGKQFGITKQYMRFIHVQYLQT